MSEPREIDRRLGDLEEVVDGPEGAKLLLYIVDTLVELLEARGVITRIEAQAVLGEAVRKWTYGSSG